jgi:hypothetical protein
MVSGGLHPELLKTDELEVIPAALKAIEWIVTGLESHPKASAARIHAMAGTGRRHRSVVLVASPGASRATARRGASSRIGAWAPWQLAHVLMSRFSWGVNPRHHPRNADRQQRVTILSGHHRTR